MKNVLNILIIALLTLLFMNIFFWGNVKKEGLHIDFSQKNYTVPASVALKVSNNSKESVKIDTCKDISILKNGEKLNISENCEIIEVKPWQTQDIDYKSQYEKFSETWKYVMDANPSWKKFISEMEVSHKWAFSKLFVTLIYAPIYNLFVFLINIFNHSLGWAIIAITIIIRIALIYPQHKSMVSQKKLQELQPALKKIQEENKWNQQAIWMKVLELYKKEKVNPFGSMWFLFIQLPIILVLYNIILSVTDPSNIYYLYDFDFVKNFTINSIDKNFYWLDLLKSGWTQWIILAFIVWIIQFFQIKLSIMFNKSWTKKDSIVLEKKQWENDYSKMMPSQESMNKVMLYSLPIIIGFATYVLFAWVWIYFWIWTLFMLVQQIIVNKMSKKST